MISSTFNKFRSIDLSLRSVLILLILVAFAGCGGNPEVEARRAEAEAERAKYEFELEKLRLTKDSTVSRADDVLPVEPTTTQVAELASSTINPVAREVVSVKRETQEVTTHDKTQRIIGDWTQVAYKKDLTEEWIEIDAEPSGWIRFQADGERCFLNADLSEKPPFLPVTYKWKVLPGNILRIEPYDLFATTPQWQEDEAYEFAGNELLIHDTGLEITRRYRRRER